MASHAMPSLLVGHGEAVTYTTAGGAASSGTAIVQDRGASQTGDLALFTVESSFVATPALGCYFTWNSRRWRVSVWQLVPGGIWEIVCEASIATDPTRGGIA